MSPSEAGLSREAVIDAALAVLADSGIDGLSMRALAERLGVKAASLYWHFRDKEQLIDQLAEALLERVDLPAAGVWRDRISSACHSLHEQLHRYGAAPVLLAAVPTVARSELVAAIAGVLDGAGLAGPGGAALTLVLAVATAPAVAPAEALPVAGSVTRLLIDSGAYKTSLRAGAPGGEAARASSGGRSPQVEMKDGRVIVRSVRGRHQGSIELSPDHTWDIEVGSGVWQAALDLSGLRLAALTLDSGLGKVVIVLPRPLGVVPLRINSGVVGVTLRRPTSAAVVATVQAGSARIRLDGEAVKAGRGGNEWATQGGRQSADRYELTILSGSVRVSLDASAPEAVTPPPARATADTGAPWELVLDGVEHRLAHVD